MPDDEIPAGFEKLLEHLKQSRGFDFSGYKRASLIRRIEKRMRSVGIADYEHYVEWLETNPDEFVTLFNAILINVTGFFRDAPTWAYLRDEVLPRRLAELPDDQPIRVWTAGCASGEEAYTVAMTLAEILGVAEFARRVKVYGTDVDEEALQLARQATYSASDASGVPAELRDKYFEPSGDNFVFRSDLRRSVIFGRLDVLHDAPISRLELLTCRNTLMYFNTETQSQVIERFHFALNDEAILVLGKAETLLSRSELFRPIDRKRRIFSKSPMTGRERTSGRLQLPVESRSHTGPTDMHVAAFAASPIPTLLFDREGVLVDANDSGLQVSGVTKHELGSVLQDLDISYRPVDLRTPISQVFSERRRLRLPNVSWIVDGSPRRFDIEVVPLIESTGTIGASISFHDHTQLYDLDERLKLSTLELDQAYQEVQSTNEELETTNEELQSTIEELETTNEELQSTNEELETINEELESTNDELHAVNDELRVRGEQVDQLNHFLQAIFVSFRGGVVVVDAERKIRVWNTKSEDLWGLREEEVRGVDILAIDIGLPVDQLARPLQRCLESNDGTDMVTLAAVNRRGRSVSCRVSLTPLHSDGIADGVILVMEPTEVGG